MIPDDTMSSLDFFEDSRDILEKTIELYVETGLEITGIQEFPAVKDIFSKAFSCESLTLEEFHDALVVMEIKKITTHVRDHGFDILETTIWLKRIQNSSELKNILQKSGPAACLLESAKMFNHDELERLRSCAYKIDRIKDLICPKIPDGLQKGLSNPLKSNAHDLDPPFESDLSPIQMRCLALVSHNKLKPTMRKFVEANVNILKKFCLTGTDSTMTMLREVFKEDPKVVYGLSCKSGPLGGDAELVSQMCHGHIGGIIFFQDPMQSHVHHSDIECLNRQALIYNIMCARNPTSALMLVHTLRSALMENRPELMPSFIFTLECPTVDIYKKDQQKVIDDNIHDK